MASFRFINYRFNEDTLTAFFSYEGPDSTRFTEMVQFAAPETPETKESPKPLDQALLDRALFLSFVLIGTSYYKAHPVREVDLPKRIDEFQARFFTTVYQEGLSQFAYENHLTRQDLAEFKPSGAAEKSLPANFSSGALSLQSGGKDSLLTAELMKEDISTFWYLGSSEYCPDLLKTLGKPLQAAVRTLDMPALKTAGGLNGHVPITYIIESLALVQAIINRERTVLVSIGREGAEPHAEIGDLKVNHQWSKTKEAADLFSEYVKNYISPDLEVKSELRKYSELKVAELFAVNCWEKYGQKFSSCNVANYKQQNDNKALQWCGHCPKCANSYLLFAPFINPEELNALFPNGCLFREESLWDDFKGLLGIDGAMKPFECVGERAELRQAYHMRKDKTASLPFEVPPPPEDYDYKEEKC